jgi:hypothetical protein
LRGRNESLLNRPKGIIRKGAEELGQDILEEERESKHEVGEPNEIERLRLQIQQEKKRGPVWGHFV